MSRRGGADPTAAGGQLTAEQARTLTDEVKADAAALWAKLLALYEGGAHTALGYASWGDHCRERWSMSRTFAYDTINSTKLVGQLSPIGDTRPQSEAVARELAPLRDEPEAMREACAPPWSAPGTWGRSQRSSGSATRRGCEAVRGGPAPLGGRAAVRRRAGVGRQARARRGLGRHAEAPQRNGGSLEASLTQQFGRR